MLIDDLPFRIARSGAPVIDFNDASAAVEALSGLGYEFVVPGTPGRIVETDEMLGHMARWISQNTSLPMNLAHAVLREVARLGLRIREPDRHPSGLRTTEPAFTAVRPFGAKTAPAMQPIDKRGPGNWKRHA
jgi:hypothetical protein